MNKAIMSKGAIKFALIFAVLIGVILSIYMIPSARTATSQEVSTSSSAIIGNNVAISMSTNLSTGILFGQVQQNTNDNNATGNFNSSDMTEYLIHIDSTTNTYVDFCIKDNQPLTSGSYNIPNTNYKYSYSGTTNDVTTPAIPGATAITTAYAYLGALNGSMATNTSYYRFTLSVPSGQSAGTYSNTVYFKGTENITAC